MSDRGFKLIPVVLAAALLPFCGGKTSGSSEAHFLEPCGAGCTGGFECVCGVCTQPCEADTACSGLGGASSVCAAGASGSGCGQSICDVLCDKDTDCGGVGEGFACEGGRCRHRVAASCDDLENELNLFAAASKECAVDDDCVPVDSPCYTQESCTATVALSSGHDSSEWNRLSGKLQSCRGVCTGCLMVAPPPACVAGKCQLGGGAAPTCRERELEAAQTVGTAVEQADVTCSGDADCVQIGSSTRCHATCGAIVSKAGADELRSVIEGLDTGLCESFEADGCIAIPPPCLALGPPACIGGQCGFGYCGDAACSAGETPAACPADCTR